MLILLVISAYLLGSVPFGVILAKIFAGIDVRQAGSGNIGATNVRRVAGNTLGLATLIADAAKGALPVGLALWFAPTGEAIRPFYPLAPLLAAFLGHLFPIYSRFKGGGKGVATAGGGLYLLSPISGLIATAAFLAIVTAPRRVSLGSLGAAALLPLILLLTTHTLPNVLAMIVVAVLIWMRHQENIKRLLAGTEPRLW